MHDDLIDAVNWAVKENVTTRDRIAIYGGSYGGYATLTGLTFTPDVFACGVDIVGPSNLITLIESFPAYWQPFLEGTWYKRVGDPRNEEGRKLLLSRSPITQGRPDQEAAADRAGRERSARHAEGIGPDRRRDEGEEHSRSPMCCIRTRATASRARRTARRSTRSAKAFSRSASAAGRSRSASTSRARRSRCSKAREFVPGLKEAAPGS